MLKVTFRFHNQQFSFSLSGKFNYLSGNFRRYIYN